MAEATSFSVRSRFTAPPRASVSRWAPIGSAPPTATNAPRESCQEKNAPGSRGWIERQMGFEAERPLVVAIEKEAQS